MTGDREILTKALEYAVPAFAAKKVGTTLLSQPAPDDEILGPINAAIKKCGAFQAVAGHVLFSAVSGLVLDAPRLAGPLLYRAEEGIPTAVEWLLRLLCTRQAQGVFKAAIWGLSIDKELPLCNSFRLLPFALLPESNVKNRILHRAGPLFDKSVWWSTSWFDEPQAAFIREVPNFPYIRTDNASFKAFDRLAQEARDLWTLMEAISVGHPLAFGFWFEYADQDLDLASWENNISWSLPEITPRVAHHTPADAQAIKDNLRQYMALPTKLRSNLLRSMNRFTLSQCRHQMVDRVLDLALAFEIAVSGGKGDNAPPSWKVPVRSAQLIGGDLERRQDNRRRISAFYKLRNIGTHGGRLTAADETILQEATDIYRDLLRSFLRFAKEPDWNSLELQPFLEERGPLIN